MAVLEKDGLWQYIDESGNIYILYPVTQLENVAGTGKLIQSTDGKTLKTLDGTNIAFVTAADLEALADEANSDTRVEYVNNVLKTLGGTEIVMGNAKIATGSYVGTGANGASNPNSLTFDFEPSLVIISYIGNPGSYASFGSMHFTPLLLTTEYQNGAYESNNSHTSFGKKSRDGKTIYWYSTESVVSQYNVDLTYYWVAIG